MEGMPDTNVIRILGLLEVLADNQGRMPVDELRDALEVDLDELLEALEGARLLGLLEVEGQFAYLTPFGEELVEKDVDERQDALAERIRQLPLFKAFMERYRGRRIPLSEVEEFLFQHTDELDITTAIKRFIEWGRFAGLFHYDGKRKALVVEG